jgi:hypothetical protein
MEGNSTCPKRICAICNKEINCPEECFVVEDGTNPSNFYNKQFAYICRDCYKKSKKYTFTQQELDQHDTRIEKPLEEKISELELQLNKLDKSYKYAISEIKYLTAKNNMLKSPKDCCLDKIINYTKGQPLRVLLVDNKNKSDEINKFVEEFISELKILLDGAPFMNKISGDYVIENMKSYCCKEFKDLEGK